MIIDEKTILLRLFCDYTKMEKKKKEFSEREVVNMIVRIACAAKKPRELPE